MIAPAAETDASAPDRPNPSSVAVPKCSLRHSPAAWASKAHGGRPVAAAPTTSRSECRQAGLSSSQPSG